MAVQQQLSGTIVVIIIAMAVQVCIMLVIVVKRQIMRFAIRNRRGPHTHIGQGAPKGGLISESFSLCLKSPKKGRQITPLCIFSLGGSDLAPFFGDWMQIEKLSEINSCLKYYDEKRIVS